MWLKFMLKENQRIDLSFEFLGVLQLGSDNKWALDNSENTVLRIKHVSISILLLLAMQMALLTAPMYDVSIDKQMYVSNFRVNA